MAFKTTKMIDDLPTKQKHKDTIHLLRTSTSKIESAGLSLDDDAFNYIEFTCIIKPLDFYYNEQQHLRQHMKDSSAGRENVPSPLHMSLRCAF